MIKLKLSNDKRLVPDAAVFLARCAVISGVSAEREQFLCFLLETMLEMRVDALNDNNPYITVEMQESASGLRISFTDKGEPYVLSNNQKKMLGIGLADMFTLEQLGVDGQRLTLCFKQAGLVRERPHRQTVTLLDSDTTCKLTSTSDEDIIEAIRCIYAVYGYDYVHPQLYHIDHFRQRLNSGKYISVLCQNAHDQVLGHVALDELDEFPGIMEYCNLVSKPFARGLGVAGKLTDLVLEAGKKHQTGGLFSRPVMQHTATQKILSRFGFIPCGMKFNAMSTDQVTDSELRSRNTRLHWAYSMAIIDKKTEHILHLPDECRSYILDIFDRSDLNYRAEDKSAPSAVQSELSFKANNADKTIDVTVNRIGPDFEERMEIFRKEIKSSLIKTILVYLNMNDPACPDCYRYFRENGYIFSGCFPGSKAGDYILLQDLRGNPIDKSVIVAEPAYEQMLNRLYSMME